MEKKLIRSCCENVSHIPNIKKNLPSDAHLKNVSELFKALSDPTRTKIVHALLEYEMCVGEIANFLAISQSNVSHQLKILRDANIVKFKKEGKMSFYRLNSDKIESILTLAFEHMKDA